MRHECPNGHASVIRNDPATTGLLAMCDRCGWEAPFAVARDEQEYVPKHNHEAERAQLDEQKRRQLAAGGKEHTSRRGD